MSNTIPRIYLVFYSEFVMHRQPQTRQYVAVLSAYDAADALVETDLRLKRGRSGMHVSYEIVSVRPPSTTSELEQRLLTESADVGKEDWYAVDLTERTEGR